MMMVRRGVLTVITEYSYNTIDSGNGNFYLEIGKFRDVVKATHLMYNDKIIQWIEERDWVNHINIGHIFSKEEEINIPKQIGYILW